MDLSDWQPLDQLDGREIKGTLEARFLAESGRVRKSGAPFLQVTLRDIPAALVHHKPADARLTSLAARNYLAPLAGSAFEYELEVRHAGGTYRSPGVACVTMREKTALGTDARTRSAQRDITRASMTGLIDDDLHRRASFRLSNRSRLRSLANAQESGYLESSDWELLVLFAQWQGADDNWQLSPAPNTQLAGLDARLTPAGIRRDFRMTDLFGRD